MKLPTSCIIEISSASLGRQSNHDGRMGAAAVESFQKLLHVIPKFRTVQDGVCIPVVGFTNEADLETILHCCASFTARPLDVIEVGLMQEATTATQRVTICLLGRQLRLPVVLVDESVGPKNVSGALRLALGTENTIAFQYNNFVPNRSTVSLANYLKTAFRAVVVD